MTTDKDVRRAHGLVDDMAKGYQLTVEELEHLRNLLPELPKQKTVEELTKHVFTACATSCEDEWGGGGYGSEITLEHWLEELHKQLKGLKDTPATVPAKPAHPEFLQTGAEYQEAPWGTIVAMKNSGTAWVKKSDWWWNTDGDGRADSQFLWGVPRKVLRWGGGA